MTVLIKWTPPAQGGRHTPARSGYRTVIRLEGEPECPENAWTFCLKDIRPIEHSTTTLATGHFPVAGAPSEKMRSGVQFQLLEGSQVVAHGLVLTSDEVDARVKSLVSSLAVV